MKDRIPLYPGRVKMTPVAGQVNTYDMVRADQPEQEGTPLNKDTLLKDATAAALGLSQADPTVDDALAKLNADKPGRDDLGTVIYDGKKYEVVPYLGTNFFPSLPYRAPYIYINNKYIGVFGTSSQQFYDLETRNLVSQTEMTLKDVDSEGNESYPYPDPGTDDNLFILKHTSTLYAINPETKATLTLYTGSYWYYAGTRGNVAYFYRQSSNTIYVKRYNVDTLTALTDISFSVSSYNYASAWFYDSGYLYRIVNSNGSLILHAYDLDNGALSTQTVSTGNYVSASPNIIFVDYGTGDIYFFIATSSGVYKFSRYNRISGVLSDIATGLSYSYITYSGHVDDDTVIVKLSDNRIYKMSLSDWGNPLAVSKDTYSNGDFFSIGNYQKFYLDDYFRVYGSTLISVNDFTVKLYLQRKESPNSDFSTAYITKRPGGYIISSAELKTTEISTYRYYGVTTEALSRALVYEPHYMKEVQ